MPVDRDRTAASTFFLNSHLRLRTGLRAWSPGKRLATIQVARAGSIAVQTVGDQASVALVTDRIDERTIDAAHSHDYSQLG
jgi:hypothetical protein